MMNKMQKLIHGGDATNNAAASSLIFRARPPQTRIVPIVDHRGRLRASSSPSPMDIISEKTEASSSTAAKSNNSNPHLEFELRKHWRVDWEPLDFVGLYESVEGLLRQKYAHGNNNEFSYYDDWLELIHCTDEYNVSKELCVEFYSSYKFKENVEGMNDEEFMRFELGGRPHQMSLKDFTSCLEIYSKERLSDDYIWSGVKISTHALKRFDPNTVWKNFSSSNSWSDPALDNGCDFTNNSVLSIDKVEFRLIHMFLTHTIFYRTQDRDKVYLSDLWYLEQIRSKTTHVNIPYCVAYYLYHFATADKKTMCGGHFVTLIARHLGVDIPLKRYYNANGGISDMPIHWRDYPIFLYPDYVKSNIIHFRGTQLQIYKTKEEIRDCAYKGTDDCAYEETAEKEKEEILRQHSYLRKGSQQMSLMRADDYAIYLPTSSY
ncbi:uncharacterized protein [Rutidosis leptorrhynchoides]|uniref:uncharacterized protein isoform X1 n=1 Tax=Rutidosis leptorrhynchoides TaxID=125765 RepID=UPI003A990948